MDAKSPPALAQDTRWVAAAWQFARLAAPYWVAREGWVARAAKLLLLLSLTVAQVALVIWTSYWNRAFFDALDARSLGELLRQIAIFGLILVLTLAVIALHMYVKRLLQLDWRRWLTRLLMDQWMNPACHYHLQFAHGEHDNPDQRIAEDARISTESAISLAHSMIYSLLIGASFIDILFSVSGSASIPGTNVAVPGYMVILAFLYAGAGATLGLMFGRPLVRTTNRLQSLEANLRFGLAQSRQHSESIALMRGEGLERQSAAGLFAEVAGGWRRQSLAYVGIVSFSAAYGNLLPVFPILVAAPQYIAGSMSLGLLMQAAQAFQQLTSALSWPIDNLGALAQWRASAERVVCLHRAMQAVEKDERATAGARLRLANSGQHELAIHRLRLATPAGATLLDGFDLRVRRGERVLIVGDSAVTLAFFKAVAGLWPWGSGEIELPKGPGLVFVPQHPFLPVGSLRAVLCYPQDSGHYDDALLYRALECAGAAWLSPRLGESDDWNRVLALGAQQRLGMARLFLHKPAWVFLDEAINTFDTKGRAGMMVTLHHELPSSTILAISLHGDDDHFYDRKLELRRSEDEGIEPEKATLTLVAGGSVSGGGRV